MIYGSPNDSHARAHVLTSPTHIASKDVCKAATKPAGHDHHPSPPPPSLPAPFSLPPLPPSPPPDCHPATRRQDMEPLVSPSSSLPHLHSVSETSIVSSCNRSSDVGNSNSHDMSHDKSHDMSHDWDSEEEEEEEEDEEWCESLLPPVTVSSFPFLSGDPTALGHMLNACGGGMGWREWFASVCVTKIIVMATFAV